MRKFLLMFALVVGGFFIMGSPVAAQESGKNIEYEQMQTAPPSATWKKK